VQQHKLVYCAANIAVACVRVSGSVCRCVYLGVGSVWCGSVSVPVPACVCLCLRLHVFLWSCVAEKRYGDILLLSYLAEDYHLIGAKVVEFFHAATLFPQLQFAMKVSVG
jgi:hypothetical protein